MDWKGTVKEEAVIIKKCGGPETKLIYDTEALARFYLSFSSGTPAHSIWVVNVTFSVEMKEK